MDDQKPSKAPPQSSPSPSGGWESPTVGFPGVGGDGKPLTDLPVVSVKPDDSSKDLCDACRMTGLAIMPVRYAVLPQDCIAYPVKDGRACSESIGQAGYSYGLRVLRQGMLYVFYESGPFGKNFWQAYAVAQNGEMRLQPSAQSAQPIVGGGLPPCKREGHDYRRTRFIVIPKPQQCCKVWIAFSNDPWTPATLDRYAGDTKQRADRMQCIEPASWVSSPTRQQDILPLSKADDLKMAMEYATFAQPVGDHPLFPYFRAPKPISTDSGDYRAAVLASNSTRYPWSLRNQRALGDGESDLSLKADFQTMKAASVKPGSKDPGTPMMLALWDPVGVAHELNGFRHDVVGHIARYYIERDMQVGAIEQFRSIELLLQQHAAVMAGKMRQASQDEARRQIEEGNEWAESSLQSDEQKIAADERALMERYRQGEIDWQAYKSGRSSSIARNQPFDEARQREIEYRYSFHDSLRVIDNPDRLAETERLALAWNRSQAQRDWNGKYRPLVDAIAIAAFEAKLQAFMDAAMALLERCSEVLGRWLKNDLFLTVLEDYDQEDLPSGIAFGDVITDAIDGLTIDTQGRKLIEAFIADIAAEERGSLVWRVMALNQRDARPELQNYLRSAEQKKDTPMASIGAAWGAFTAGAAQLKKLVGHYKDMSELSQKTEAKAPWEKALKNTGADRFAVTVGTYMLKRLRLQDYGETVGSAMVTHLLSTRAFMSELESQNLINLRAKLEPAYARFFKEKLEQYRQDPATRNGAMALALADAERNKELGTRVLRAAWAQASDKAKSAIRLAAIAGSLELVNFLNILVKSDKGSKDYAQLLSSGISMSSTYMLAANKVTEELYDKLYNGSSRSVANTKALGKLLGGTASGVSLLLDYSAIDEYVGNRNALALAYVIKAFADFSASASQLLTALSHSAPVVQRAFGGQRAVVFFNGLEDYLVKEGGKKAALKAGSGLSVRLLGKAMLRLGTWQVTLVLIGVDALIWYLTPDELEKWCEQNYFGIVRAPGAFGFGGSDPKFKTGKEQSEAFDKAVGAMGIAAPAASNKSDPH
ncbi:T6SS effector BTH_I2691 family protein [Xanthomonas cerealis]|uniref:T6SS effector BTH_I2691 family protein n=1 Tax=Xanthomonas cerealis TaxID=3390025 RepID=UPI000B29BEAA|nr:T6SS effector BTH_I2691 family protein [Xanthomonas translucens]UKE45833.1 hypothetical protein KHA79_11645 [Xanthomonas translucens pv. cerealis]